MLTDRHGILDRRRGFSSGSNESKRKLATHSPETRLVRDDRNGSRGSKSRERETMIKNEGRKKTKTGKGEEEAERESERVTKLLSAADFWFRCANSFHLMRTGEALHQSWKKPPRQHSMRERATDGETGWRCGHSKVETVFASLDPARGQWRRRCRPLWIVFVTRLQATLASSKRDRLILTGRCDRANFDKLQ